MSAVVTIVLVSPNETIDQLNAKLNLASGGPTPSRNDLINRAINLLSGALVGNEPAGTVQVTTRGTDPAVGTNGTHSVQVTVNVG